MFIKNIEYHYVYLDGGLAGPPSPENSNLYNLHTKVTYKKPLTHLLTGKHNYSSGLQISLGNKYTRLSSIHLPFPSHELFHLTEIKYKVISNLAYNACLTLQKKRWRRQRYSSGTSLTFPRSWSCQSSTTSTRITYQC